MSEAQAEGAGEIGLCFGGVDDQVREGQQAVQGKDTGDDRQAPGPLGVGRVG